MNFLFTHISPDDIKRDNYTQWVQNKIPHYVFLQIEHTYRIHNGRCKIYLVCNRNNIDISDIKYINKYCIETIEFNNIKNDFFIHSIIHAGYYCFDLDLVCLLKFPIISYVMKKYNINEILYQENDVGVYMNFKMVREYFKGVCVCGETQPDALLTAICYCDQIEIMDNISQFILECLYKHIKLSDYSAIKFFQDKYHVLNVLPSIPSDTNKYIIFDPASYGQYMAGNNQENRISFIDRNHRIVKEFLWNNRVCIYHDNGIYKFQYNNKIYSLFNIHIHNKLAIERIINGL